MNNLIIILGVMVVFSVGIGFYPLWGHAEKTKTKLSKIFLLLFTVAVPFIALYIYMGAPGIIALLQTL